MDKISTIFYIIDNRNNELDLVIEADKLFSKDLSEFECVTSFLDTLHLEPSKETIEKILQYSKNSKI